MLSSNKNSRPGLATGPAGDFQVVMAGVALPHAYRSRARTFWGFWLAMESTVVPDCTRIWARVRAAVSAAKSHSTPVRKSSDASHSIASMRSATYVLKN